MNFHRVKAIISKEFIQIKRDPPSLVIIFVMPIMMLLLFGYAVTTDIENVATVVVDNSKTMESRALIDSFRNTGIFVITQQVANQQQVAKLIDDGQAKVGILIPPDYKEKLLRKEQAQVQVIIDGSDPLVSKTALSSAQLIGMVNSVKLKAQQLGGQGNLLQQQIDLRARVWYNPDMESVKFNVPGLIGLIMQNITIMLTAFALVRERERGTMEQLIITPVKPFELILGKLVPYVIIAFIDILVTLAIGTFWFNVPINGSVVLLLLLSLVFLLVALGLGMLVSTVAKTQLQAMQMAFLILLPSVLLSGFIFPRQSMPKFVQLLGNIIPLTYFLEILRGIIIKGIGLSELWPQVTLLAALGVGLMFISAKRFKKKLD